MAVIATVACLAGCGEDAAPVTAAAPVRRAVVVAVASADAGTAEPFELNYNYTPIGKRDPFRSPIDEDVNKGIKGADSDQICPEALCQFDLEQLTLVAVVSGDANPVAMLEDPNKTGHIVRRNTKVGKQGGKVTQILRDCVVITEFYMGSDGKKSPNRITICVKKEAAQEETRDLFNNKATE